MYINEVVSYLGAWETFKNNHPNLLDEIDQILEIVLERTYTELKSFNSTNKENLKFNVLAFVRESLKYELENSQWHDFNSEHQFTNPRATYLGLMKDSCYIKITTSAASSILMSWIYRDIELANKETNVSVPILLVIDFTGDEFLNKFDDRNFYFNSPLSIQSRNLKFVKNSLKKVSPLKFEHPFLVLGIKLEKKPINIVEIEHEKFKDDKHIRVDRCITFEPEYYQAGIGILSYFGTILRDKYPDQNATVKIEQHDLTVRMIIETEDGNIETLEKALHEYELVLKGQKSAEEFYLSPIKALELKNQLHLFKFQIESQKEIIALQRGQILSLEDIVDKALAPITHPPVTIINQLNNTQSVNINHQTALNQSYDDLDELIDLADKDSLKKRFERALTALDAAQNLDEPEEIKNSGGMKQLAKILNEANEIGSEVNDLVEKGGQAVELIKNLGRKYNSVAEWCGLPVIPSIFVKE